jgi:hypothetical protein
MASRNHATPLRGPRPQIPRSSKESPVVAVRLHERVSSTLRPVRVLWERHPTGFSVDALSRR